MQWWCVATSGEIQCGWGQGCLLKTDSTWEVSLQKCSLTKNLKQILHTRGSYLMCQSWLQAAFCFKQIGLPWWLRWPANTGDLSSVPGSGRSPGGGNGNPLQCSFLENPMDRGAWWAAVHRVAKNQTWLKRLSTQCLYFKQERWQISAMFGGPWPWKLYVKFGICI